MATKGTVPLFEEDYDLGKPAELPGKFVSMMIGGAMAIAAIAGGQYLVNRAQSLAGGDGSDDGFEVI